MLVEYAESLLFVSAFFFILFILLYFKRNTVAQFILFDMN